MKTSDTHNQRFANMTFASVYSLYLAKVEKKGRTASGVSVVNGLQYQEGAGTDKSKSNFRNIL